MIENFEAIKEQLKELSSIVNSFKSEAVQLRIVELILGSASQEQPSRERQDDERKDRAVNKPTGETQKTAAQQSARVGRRASAGNGAVATVAQLADGAFFEKPRTINDIIHHCETSLARRFKPNEISGKLARMVRDGELARVKNAEDQYEYKKK